MKIQQSLFQCFGLPVSLFVGLTLTQTLGAQQVAVETASQSGAGEVVSAVDPMPVVDKYSINKAEGDSSTAGNAAEENNMFDTDRGVAMVDSDGDGFPDLTEALEQTNPLDAKVFPGSEALNEADELGDPGFPAASCRSGYRQIGTRLCISINVLNATTYANALVYCRDRRGRVASYGDLRYLYVRSSFDAAYNPNGRWIGNFVDDDKALCGNRSITTNNDPDIGNFEGECSRFNSRNYWCAHDRF